MVWSVQKANTLSLIERISMKQNANDRSMKYGQKQRWGMLKDVWM